MIKTYPFDVADFLKNNAERKAYLEECLKENDPELLALAIGDVARSYGMTKLSKKTGLSRENLYRSFGKVGNPTLATFMSVISALGLKMTLKTIKQVKH